MKGCASWPILPPLRVLVTLSLAATIPRILPSYEPGSPATRRALTIWTGFAGPTGSAARTVMLRVVPGTVADIVAVAVAGEFQ